MGYTLLQIGEILLKADRTMYKIGSVAYDDMFNELDEALDYNRDIIYIYKKAVEYADDFYVGTEKLDTVVEKLGQKVAVYDYGQLTPVYSDVTIVTSVIPLGAVLNDLDDVTITNVQNNQILKYNSALAQWINTGTSSAIRFKQSFTATLNQTVFTTTSPFEPYLLDVFLNGVRLNESNYTTFGDYQITLLDGSLADDVIDVIIYDPVTDILDISGYVKNTRTLTINGITYDLSANRTWSVGTVSSVDMSVPTGLTISGNPITTSGTLAITLTSGYSIPTTASQTNWDTAYTNRITSLTTTGTSGAATLIGNVLNIPQYAGGGGGGTVTSITSGNGMNFTTITTTGSIVLGTPSSTTLASTNAVTSTSHTHAFAPGGTTAQYISGAGTLITFPTLTNGTVTSVDALTLGTTGTDLSSSVANSTTTPVITLNVPSASASNRGVLTSTDWSAFNSKESALTFSSPLSRSVNTISIPVATTSVNGYLSSTDWTTFNNKQAALSGTGFVKISGTTISYDNSTYYLASNPSAFIALTALTASAPLSYNNTTGAFAITQASGSVNGFLSSTDWTTFNNKTSNTGTVTSVGLSSATSGVTIGSTPITTSGTITLAIATASGSQNGLLSSTDWTTFNNKQGTISLTTIGTGGAATLIANVLNIPQYSGGGGGGSVTSVDMSVPTGLTISGNPITTSGTLALGLASGYSIPTTASQATWTTAYNDSIVSAAVTGTTTKTLTLTQQDAGTITASWTDINTDAVTSVFGRTGAVVSAEGDYTLTQLGDVTISSPTTGQVLKYNGSGWVNNTDTDTGLTSVGLSMPVAFSVANTPLTANGTLAVTAIGTAAQYIRGDGQLATLPSGSSGGSSINYYLNGSVNQGTIGGSTYYEMNRTAVLGSGTDFTRTHSAGNGLIAQFITDANDPNRLEIPVGAWNFEMYFSSSSSGGSPSFYVELLKYDGTTFTSIASNVSNPEGITGGTTVDLYITSLAIPQTALLTTDRLAIRVYVTTSGKDITLHTEDNNLCEIITTFASGVSALNGLTANTQYFAVGTSGTDFAISSATDTHTFNLPTASASNRGALSSANWITFNSKQDALSGTGFVKISGTTISYDNSTYLTANQSITLSGAVTGSGATAITTTLANSVVGIANLSATGTPSASTYLRGDNTWATVSSGGGGITRSVSNISTATTAAATALIDYVYFISGTTTLTLPTAVGNINRYTLKNVGTNIVTINTTSSQTIDGSTSITLPVTYTALDIVSDGTNWNII